MPFSVSDFQDLLRLLETQPEWRSELRRLLLSEEFLRLPQQIAELTSVVRELAETQRRAEERLSRVEERVGRLEEAVVALAEAQRRAEERLGQVEERVGRLEEAMAALAETQQRMEEGFLRLEAAVGILADGLRRTRQQGGSLAELVGARAEGDAERVLVPMLQEKGYRLLARPGTLFLDGEVDVALPVEDASGQCFWVLVEAKARLHRGDVQAWTRKLSDRRFRKRLALAGVHGDVLAYAFGIRVAHDAEGVAQEAGVGLLDQWGERLAPRVRA